MKTPGQKAIYWIEQFCLVPFGFDKGQYVRLTTAQKEILHGFSTATKRREIAAPLSSYLALFHIAGPRYLAAHVSALPLSADSFTTWNAVGPDLRPF